MACPTWSFTHRHDDLYGMDDGSVAYDAVVRQEDYYPSARRALERFESCVSGGKGGGVINFGRFDALAARDGHAAGAGGEPVAALFDTPQEFKGRRGEFFGPGERVRMVLRGEQYMPDHCFYTPDMVDSVMKHDAAIMQRYGYTWDAFVGESGGKDEC